MWYFAIHNERKGPVDEAAFRELVAQGVITPETLVWQQGMANWQPYGTLADPATTAEKTPSAAPTAASSGANREDHPKYTLRAHTGTGPTSVNAGVGINQHLCCECGRIFPDTDMAQHQQSWVCNSCKPVYFQRVREGTGTSAWGRNDNLTEYAGFWIRFAAKFIDGFVTAAVMVPLIVVIAIVCGANFSEESSASNKLLMQVIGFTISSSVGLLYNGLMVAKWGATVGKMACGLRVVTPDGAPLTMGRAFGRAAADLVTGFTCSIGYIIAAFDSQKRALHDHLASTRVMRKG